MGNINSKGGIIMTVKVVIDSICSPSLNLVREHNIPIVPINIHVGEDIFEDVIDVDAQELYEKLEKDEVKITTSAPSYERFYQEFKMAIESYDHCLCMTVASSVSNTYSLAMKAREEFNEKDRDRIIIFDTNTAGPASSLLVMEAIKMAENQEDIDQILNVLNELRPNAKFSLILSTLKYVQRSGRIGKVASVAGDLFNIKPLVYLKNGEIKFFGRARGMNQGYKMMIEELKKDTEGKDMLRVAISHSNVEDEALKLKSMIEEVYPDLSIDISPLTLAIGLHVGPGVVSIGYTYK